jgi:hypothetical protein
VGEADQTRGFKAGDPDIHNILDAGMRAAREKEQEIE